tara:strand:+ start:21414 stop:22223 length:810 start_codon:yes stop_codon:yes gene_type:complete
MIIGETKLRNIVREEIELRIIKQTITEVISEMQLDLTEERRLILEKSLLDSIKSAARKAGVSISVMAALAFGTQVASNVQELEGVGTTPAAAEQLQNAIEAGQNISDARAEFIEDAIASSSREGETPADLEQGIGADDAKDIAMDRLEAEFASRGEIESTGKMQQTARGGVYITYVPYDSLPKGFKDTFTRGAEKEDLKQYYQTMDIQELADLVRDFNKWGSEGQGSFYKSESTGTRLLPSSWSIAYKAWQDKTAERGAKGKSLAKENA